MPGAEDYILNPVDIIQSLFDKDAASHDASIKEYFSKRLSNPTSMSWVPSLNDTPLHDLRTNTLVKFRCMVQDMNDPEYYMGVYEVSNETTGEKKLMSGKYKDVAECQPGWKIQTESDANQTLDRLPLYCVPVPGENQWVKEMHREASRANTTPSGSSYMPRQKRPVDEDTMDTSDTPTPEQPAAAATGSSTKKHKAAAEAGQGAKTTPELLFPLPGESGPAVIVKVHEDRESFKVNDVVEFVGILSADPAMAGFDNSDEMDAIEMKPVEEVSTPPPPSLVPRLHAILSHHLTHVNPLLPVDLTDSQETSEVQKVLATARDSRSKLLSVLEQLTCGDQLAAEFLLCHLISNVYARQDVVPLGKFSINLSGCPRESSFADHCYAILKKLVCKSHLLDMSLSNMNSLVFSPKKDYDLNRLRPGMLQLSERTHLVVNETALQEGQLDANGVQNITALGSLIRWQKVDYNFSFHRQEFPSNLVVLILSEGKSMLPADCQVPIVSQTQVSNLEEHFGQIDRSLGPALLAELRAYLTVVQLLDYSLPEAVQKDIEESFVEMRKDDPKNMSVDDFHSLLVISRLLSLSYGRRELTAEVWERAKQMERNRKQRLATSGTTS